MSWKDEFKEIYGMYLVTETITKDTFNEKFVLPMLHITLQIDILHAKVLNAQHVLNFILRRKM